MPKKKNPPSKPASSPHPTFPPAEPLAVPLPSGDGGSPTPVWTERFSYSAIRAYETCPAKWNFRYREQRRVEENARALEMGMVVHRVLESAFRGKPEEMLTNAWAALDSEMRKCIYLRDQADWKSCREMVANGIALHERVTRNEPGRRIQDIEVEFSLTLHPPGREDGYTFTGRIDRVDVNNGVYTVIDFKTSQRPFSHEDLDADTQLRLYGLAARMLYGADVREVRLEYWMVRHAQIQRVSSGDEALRETGEYLAMRADHAASAKEYPAIMGTHCRSCPYTGICTAFQGMLNGERLDGVTREEIAAMPDETLFSRRQIAYSTEKAAAEIRAGLDDEIRARVEERGEVSTSDWVATASVTNTRSVDLPALIRGLYAAGVPLEVLLEKLPEVSLAEADGYGRALNLPQEVFAAAREDAVMYAPSGSRLSVRKKKNRGA